MSELLDRLAELDRICAERGAPTQWFRPGLDRDSVVDALRPIIAEPPEDVIDWFAWHDGATDNRLTLGPSSFTALSLREAVDERGVRYALAADLVPILERRQDQIWSPTRLPLAWNGSGGALAIELAGPAGKTGPAYAVETYTAETYWRPAVGSLVDAVELWLNMLALTGGSYSVENQEWTCSDRSLIPRAVFDTGLVDL